MVAEVEPIRRVPGTAAAVDEVVGRDEREEVWRRWLAEGRFESQAELAEAVGVSRCLVSRVVRGVR